MTIERKKYHVPKLQHDRRAKIVRIHVEHGLVDKQSQRKADHLQFFAQLGEVGIDQRFECDHFISHQCRALSGEHRVIQGERNVKLSDQAQQDPKGVFVTFGRGQDPLDDVECVLSVGECYVHTIESVVPRLPH